MFISYLANAGGNAALTSNFANRLGVWRYVDSPYRQPVMVVVRIIARRFRWVGNNRFPVNPDPSFITQAEVDNLYALTDYISPVLTDQTKAMDAQQQLEVPVRRVKEKGPHMLLRNDSSG